jgi:hypothetical protein
MRAARQQLITKLAIRAFFESRFAADARTREQLEIFLTKTLPSELGEVTYTPSRRGDPDV